MKRPGFVCRLGRIHKGGAVPFPFWEAAFQAARGIFPFFLAAPAFGRDSAQKDARRI